jgi:hypothetical protein
MRRDDSGRDADAEDEDDDDDRPTVDQQLSSSQEDSSQGQFETIRHQRDDGEEESNTNEASLSND